MYVMPTRVHISTPPLKVKLWRKLKAPDGWKKMPYHPNSGQCVLQALDPWAAHEEWVLKDFAAKLALIRE